MNINIVKKPKKVKYLNLVKNLKIKMMNNLMNQLSNLQLVNQQHKMIDLSILYIIYYILLLNF